MKAAAYLRVSTEDQTVENQRLVLNTWAQVNNYQIIEFFEDSAVSGTIPAAEREGFHSLMELLRSEKVDAVLVYELSRVGRTFWDTLAAIKLVERYAPLVSCSPKEAFLQTTDPSVRQLLVSIISWVAEREREMLVQRVKAGMARSKAEGRFRTRPIKINDKAKFMQMLADGATYKDVMREFHVSHETAFKEIRRVKRPDTINLIKH